MIFLVSLAALYVGHHVGDHWLQTHNDALGKGAPGRTGRLHCLSHVWTLTLAKVWFLTLASVATGITWPNLWNVAAVLGLDAATHYWADRAAFHPAKEGKRVTLERLAHAMGKTEFWNLGKSAVDKHGNPAPSLGTGAYALDQSFHLAMLFVAAFLLEVMA